MIESDLLDVAKRLGIQWRSDAGCRVQDGLDTLGRYAGARIHHEHRAEQHHRQHRMEQIFHEGHQLAHLQDVRVDHAGRHIIDSQRRQVHHQKEHRLGRRHQLEQAAGLLHVKAVFPVEAFGLMAVVVKRTDDPDAGQILPEDPVQPV